VDREEERRVEYERAGYRVVAADETGDWNIYLGEELLGILSKHDREALLDSTEEPFDGLREWVEAECLAHSGPVYELLLEGAGEEGR